MATVTKLSGLSPDQAKSLDDFDLQLRPALLEMFKAVRRARAASQQYNATVLPIVSALDGTENLPTRTNLSGAVPLAKGDPGFLISYLDAFVAFYDTNLADANHLALYVKAVGSINITEDHS